VRLLSNAPRYLEELFRQTDGGSRLGDAQRLRFHQDLALLSQVFLRFIETHELDGGRPLRLAGFALRRRIYESLRELVSGRVDPEYLQRYVEGGVQLVDSSDDPTESGFFQVLETGEPAAADRMILRMAERAFYLWVEGVCLDEENQAFEKEDSPFRDRESEMIGAIAVRGATRIERGRDLMPFLRRADRNTKRIFDKLERWFLRAYDIRNASAIINYSAALGRGRAPGEPGPDLAHPAHPRAHPRRPAGPVHRRQLRVRQPSPLDRSGLLGGGRVRQRLGDLVPALPLLLGSATSRSSTPRSPGSGPASSSAICRSS
jgi:hypothetical protein